MQSRSLAGTGAVAPLAFFDANGNGIRDAGERAVEGVGFQVSGGATPARTAADGTALVSPLVPYRLRGRRSGPRNARGPARASVRARREPRAPAGAEAGNYTAAVAVTLAYN